jgi:hypothetical protein
VGTVLTSIPVFSQAPKSTDPPPQQPAKPQDSQVNPDSGNNARKAAPTRPVPNTGRAASGVTRTAPFTGAFLPFLRAELLLVRTTCDLTEDQSKALGREGAQTLRSASANYVAWQRSEARKGAPGARSAPPDSRNEIRDGVAAAVKKYLTAEQRARYQLERERRGTEEKRTAVCYLVAILDRNLLLSAEQRARLSESLSLHWDHAWCEPLEEIQRGNTLVPPVPDRYVIPFLDDVQTETWRGIQKLQSGLRYSLFAWDMTIDNDPLMNVSLDASQHAELEQLRIKRAAAENQRRAMMRASEAQQKNAQAAVKAAEVRLLAKRQAEMRAREAELDQGARRGKAEGEEKQEIAPRRPVMMLRAQFDALVFNNVGDADAAHHRFESLLALHIGEVDRSGGLTESQRKKLQVAGQGDIKRFFDNVDRAFSRINVVDGQARSLEISRQVQSLQQTLIRSDRLDDESLFAKVLSQTLDEGQLARYQKALLERSSFHSRAAIRAVVGILGNDLGLSSEQQEKFVNRLLEGSRPPKRFGRNDYWFVLHKAASLPEAKLRPIFDPTQWQMISSQLTPARGMGQWLKENGYDSGNEPAVESPAAVVTPAPRR